MLRSIPGALGSRELKYDALIIMISCIPLLVVNVVKECSLSTPYRVLLYHCSLRLVRNLMRGRFLQYERGFTILGHSDSPAPYPAHLVAQCFTGDSVKSSLLLFQMQIDIIAIKFKLIAYRIYDTCSS